MLERAGELTVIDRLEAHAARAPHRPFLCLYAGERFQVLTYGDLLARADRWAARMAQVATAGVAFVVLPTGLDQYAAYLGAMRAGLTPSFLPPPSVRQDPALYAKAHHAVFARTRPALIVADDTTRELLAPIAPGAPFLAPGEAAPPGFAPASPTPDATALLQHSSGTTGLKKGVALTFGQVDAHVGMLAQALDLGARDIVASWLPLYHDMGLVTGFLAPLTLGASVVALDPFAWVADPPSLLRAIDRHRATRAWLPNFAFALLARHRADPPLDLSSLRSLVDCSEPCRPETLERFAAAFADCRLDPGALAASYAMAETVFAVTQTRAGRPPRALALDAQALEAGRIAPARRNGRERRLLSCGAPIPGVELRIDAPYGRTGEILVRSATQQAGYFGAPDPGALAEGWRRTGDVGLFDAGELFVCGRLKEIVIVAGRNLYAGDVEAVVGAVPGVKPGRVVALGVEDAEAGTEALAVLLEPDGGCADEAELGRRVREAVSGAFDVSPRRVAVVPPGRLVKSTAGKISRAENRRWLPSHSTGKGPEMDGWAQPSSPVSPPRGPAPADTPVCGSSPLEGEGGTVARALAECFGFDASAVTLDSSPHDIPGWDSLGHTTLLLHLEALTGLGLDEAAAEAVTVGELAAALIRAAHERLAA